MSKLDFYLDNVRIVRKAGQSPVNLSDWEADLVKESVRIAAAQGQKVDKFMLRDMVASAVNAFEDVSIL